MKQTRLALGIALILGLGTSPVSLAAIKCWTNNEGVRECGNVIPPEYTQQETRTVNERGITLDVRERAPTREELAAERAREEAEKARQAEELRLRQEQAAKDRVLLSTFASEQDIIMARDRKITALEATIEITRVSLNKLENQQGEYRKRAANLERGGKPVPEDLKADMALVQKQADNKNDYIAAKQGEIEELRRQYEADLMRFRELMAAGR